MSTVPENIHIMKLRTSRALKNMILSIDFAILTFGKFFVQFSVHFRVGRYENLFIYLFFWKAIKIAGSAQKNKTGSVELAETRVFFRPHHGSTAVVKHVNNITMISMVPFAWLFLFDSKTTNRGQPPYETHSAIIRLYITRCSRSLHVHFLTLHLQLFTKLRLVKMPVSSSEINGSEGGNLTLFNLLLYLFYFISFTNFFTSSAHLWRFLIMLHLHQFCIYKEQQSRNHWMLLHT